MTAKRWIILILAVLSFAAGVIGQWVAPSALYSGADLAFALISSLLIFMWFRIDAIQRAYRRSRWLNVGVIVLAIVALPYYFFRSRGAKRGLIATAALLAVMLVSSALTTAGKYTTYYTLQAEAAQGE